MAQIIEKPLEFQEKECIINSNKLDIGGSMEFDFVITGIKRVILVGKEEYDEDRSIFSNHVSRNELIFNLSGVTTIFFGQDIFETLPGSIRFLPKGETERYEVIRKERGECIDVFFDTDRPVSKKAFVTPVLYNEKIGMLFKKIFSVWTAKDEGYYYECISLLYKIFSELQKCNTVPRRHRDKIEAGVAVLQERFSDPYLTVSELAEACGVSESYFKRLFKEQFGVPPKKYVVQLRINHACELLRTERYSVTQIATICGFSDIYFFSRQFKEYMGVSPTVFVKKYRSSR